MRPIKFRAKKRDLANEQFPELYEKKIMEFVYGTGIYQDTHNTWIILENHEKKSFSQMSAAIVDPESVGQYTGLKDKNEVEIYEGDIIKVYPFEGNIHINKDMLFKIKFESGKFIAKGIDNGFTQVLLDYYSSHCEVIENIYETPAEVTT